MSDTVYAVVCCPVMGTPYDVSEHSRLEAAISAAKIIAGTTGQRHHVEKREVVWTIR